jgi:hypothetical protein
MLWNVYLRRGKVYVPTVAQTGAGFYLDIEPVEVVLACDSEAVRNAVQKALSRGNPPVPTPTRAAFPTPVVLRFANVKSWAAFQRGATNWIILTADNRYEIKQSRNHPQGGWVPDPALTEVLPLDSGHEGVAVRMACLINRIVS